MARFSTAILAIACGLAIGYALHVESANGQETNRVVAQGIIGLEADAGYSDAARINLTALITRSDPAMQPGRGMTQQEAECAYYAKNSTPWVKQAGNLYEGRSQCER